MKKILETLKLKWAEYLLEILVITIGILGAFMLNSWNESRKTNIIEQDYLISLKAEFIYNEEKLEQVTNRNEQNTTNALELLKYTGPDKSLLKKEKFKALWFSALGNKVEYRPSTGVLDEMISSGKLGIVSNKKLMFLLSSWNGIIYKVRSQEDQLKGVRLEVNKLFRKYGNARNVFSDRGLYDIAQSKFDQKNIQLLQLVEFENTLVAFIGNSKGLNKFHYADIREINNEILELINSEINKQ